MWDWLAQNATAVSAVSTVVLAVITGVYAYLTVKAVGAAEESAESAAKLVQLEVLPVIHPNTASITRGTSSGFGWQISNVGRGAALAVRCWIELDDGTRFGEFALNVPLGAGDEPRKSARLPASKKQLDALQVDSPRATRWAEYQDALGRVYRSSWRGGDSHVYQVVTGELRPLL